jgi:hypothetical protein
MGRTVSYVKDPVVVAFKTSDRKNAKLKIKVFRNKTIDDLLDCDFVTPGIDENAVILAVGIGECFESEYKNKFKIP